MKQTCYYVTPRFMAVLACEFHTIIKNQIITV